MITYIKGDATRPQGEGHKLIIHIVNDAGKFGAGFALALSRRWKIVENNYRKWFNDGVYHNKNFELGNVQFVDIDDDLCVANMIAQHNIKDYSNIPPIRYEALDSCLKKVDEVAKEHDMSIHAPRIGSGLAGGSWVKIEKLIEENLKDLNVTIYDL